MLICLFSTFPNFLNFYISLHYILLNIIFHFLVIMIFTIKFSFLRFIQKLIDTAYITFHSNSKTAVRRLIMTLLQLTLSYIVKTIFNPFKLECYLILIVGLVMSEGVLINKK